MRLVILALTAKCFALTLNRTELYHIIQPPPAPPGADHGNNYHKLSKISQDPNFQNFVRNCKSTYLKNA